MHKLATTAPKVLIIEDDLDMSAVMAEELKVSGFTVTTADDGMSGVRHISTTKFDFIIADLQLPHLSGTDLVSLIKVSPLNNNTPITIASGQITSDAVAKLARLGVVDLIPKPFDVATLVSHVKRALGMSSQKLGYAPFLVESCKNAASDVLNFYFKDNLVVGQPFIQKERAMTDQTIGFLSIYGRTCVGSIQVAADTVFLALLAKTLFGEKSADIEPATLHPIVAEIANQIGGALKAQLETYRLFTVIGVPGVVWGTQFDLPAAVTSPKISIPFTLEGGKCSCDFAIMEIKSMLPNEEDGQVDLFIYS